MRNIKYFIVAIAVALSSVSCSLDETSYTEMEQNKFMNSASQANTVLLGVYRNLVNDAMYGYHLSLYFTLPSDIARVEGNTTNGYRAVASNSYTSSDAAPESTWQALYNAVYDANDFIERLSGKIGTYSEADQRLGAVYLAEARTLRALFYFELVRWFGNIVLMTDTEQSRQDPKTFKQVDPVEVFEFIEKDLLYAIDILPYATADNYRSDNSFRMSKGSALGLLTKVYATWAGQPVGDESKWEQAAKTARILINSGKHSLLEDFGDLWYNSANSVWNPSESLIEVSFYSPTISGSHSSGRIGKWNGVSAADGTIPSYKTTAAWRVLPSFAAAWKDYASDKRFDHSIADYRYLKGTGAVPQPLQAGYTIKDAIAKTDSKVKRSSFSNNLCPKKWDTPVYQLPENSIRDNNMSNVNWYILRYSDVLLLYAEALNEWKGVPTSDAYAAINLVRRRAGVPSLQEGMSAEEFRQAIRDERSHELAFEGHRRQDLVRWGIYYESINKAYNDLMMWDEATPAFVAVRYTRKNKNELLPIPLRDVRIADLEQNPGW